MSYNSYIYLWNHHLNKKKIQNISRTPPPPCQILHFLCSQLFHLPLAAGKHWSAFYHYIVVVFYINRIIYHVFFCVWFLSFSLMIFRFIPIVLCMNNSFLLLNIIQYSLVLLENTIPYMNIIHFLIHSRADGHSGCFQFGVIVNNIAMNICEKFLYGHMFPFILGIYLGVE